MLKKSAFINDLENIILYCGRIRAKPGIGHQIRFAPNLAGGLGGSRTHGKLTFVQTGTKLLYKYEHFFFLETARLIPLFSPTNILCLKEYPHNITKYKIKGISKIRISLLFSEPEKLRSTTLAYSQKIHFSIFLKNWEKLKGLA